ncbi:MAG TPA: ATP-dependent Clp protease proteolytic subunit [Haliscomenobacter sp.]|uniref:ClpP family protease n=1 Tax=Haliscomenobacter sp. TaxID=2717303 RepID=UPI002C16C4B8|nr:ATP-dependent Clp protease proteolytic subunit [Haliscomenobacter sp.]HOY17858.1 ATP-dependent Clp protease proteolytic subunit [Haliscomenobacter sp.]
MVQASLVPMVIDNDGGGERAYDIYSLLLKERIIFLSGEVNDVMASIVVAQLLYLSSIDPKRQINMYIQSPGGVVYSGMAIYDTMKMISTPVSTVSMGFTGSMGTFLLSSGTPGKRYALAHSTIHMHPTGGGTRGYTEDVRIATREQERLQAQIFHLMGKQSGHTRKEIEDYFLRDRFLNAQEAREFGLVDEILGDIQDLVVLNARDSEVSLVQQS